MDTKEILNQKSNNIKGDGVFLAFVSKDNSLKYKFDFRILMSLRRFNDFGFPGGKVDSDETFSMALKRELKEEINYDITKLLEENKIHHLASFVRNDFGIHSFYCVLDEEELFNIQKGYVNATHCREEVNGLCAIRVNCDKYDKSNINLMHNGFSATAKVELIKIISMIRGGKICL